jgi:hypothetical protein
MPQLSGWLWLLIDVALVALLGAALIYGIVKWRQRRRDPAVERRRDDVTRRLYRDEEIRRRVSGQE